MRRGAGAVALLGAMALSGCLLSDQEVVRTGEAVAIAGLEGSYYLLASPDEAEKIQLAGIDVRQSAIPLALDADGRSYRLGTRVPVSVRFMPIDRQFHLVQAPQPLGVIIALARIDLANGIVDLHCMPPPPRPSVMPSGLSLEALAQLLVKEIQQYKAPADRGETVALARHWAERDSPMFMRFVRSDHANRDFALGSGVPPGAKSCVSLPFK